jgi:hypothetical protein
MKSCELCAKKESCNKDYGNMFGYCNTDFEADKDKIYNKLDNLEGCEDNEAYATEIKELRAML